MRRKEKELADFGKIEELLKKEKICRLGLIDGERPYIVPMCYGYYDKVLYFHSAAEGRKITLLKNMRTVCFELESDVEPVPSVQACGWGLRYRSVIGTGPASFITDREEKISALNILMEHQTGKRNWEFLPEMLKRTCVFRIDIQEVTGKESGYAG